MQISAVCDGEAGMDPAGVFRAEERQRSWGGVILTQRSQSTRRAEAEEIDRGWELVNTGKNSMGDTERLSVLQGIREIKGWTVAGAG